MPAAEAALEQYHLRPEQVQGTGLGGRILKEDVLRTIAQPPQSGPAQDPPSPAAPSPAPAAEPVAAGREQEVVPMSRLRRTVAERLVAAQHNAALLTTFNEIDMGHVMALRKEHGEAFQTTLPGEAGLHVIFCESLH